MGLIDWLMLGQQTSWPGLITFSDTRKDNGNRSQGWCSASYINKFVPSSMFDINII